MNLKDYNGKIKTLDELEKIAAAARAAGKTIAFANGCFDLVHVGHIRYLEDAKNAADILIVGINSDSSVKQLKGSNRPYVAENGRLMMVAAIEAVDYLVLFDDLRVDNLLLTIKPDFHAKGTDYTEQTVPEKDIVASYGGDIIITGDPKDHSSTNVIEQIKSRIEK